MSGNNYNVDYKLSVLKKDLPNPPKNVKQQIKSAIETKLMINPIEFGKPLQYSLKGFRRLRVGDYRIVYKIDDKNKVINVVAIKSVREIYN